ncbi:MAG TPA: amino acid adenylation domain-containing protein, partial [Hymenobacter sp.]
VYSEEGGTVYQEIQPGDSWQLTQTQGSTYREDPTGLQAYIQHQSKLPFNLSDDYMFRSELIELAQEEYVLIVTMHHIASDAWSVPILVREVAELYSAYTGGRESSLTALPLQYGDYSLWQRGYLQGELLESKLAYWKNKLEEVSPLQLPIDYVRPASVSTRGSSCSFSIEKEVLQGLHALNQQQGTTLYMTLLAAFNVLLYRYSGQEDICVGTSIAGRPQQELEKLIGFFVNTLALRSRVEGDKPFTELLSAVKNTTLEAYSHQEVPFEKVVEAVVRERDPGRSPLFQVMLVLQNTPDAPVLKLGEGELQLSAEPYEQTTVKFDLTFFINESSRGLQGTVQYSTDLYKAATIQQMMSHFGNLLRSVVNNPWQQVGLLSMLSPAEEHTLLEEINSSQADYPQDTTIISLFEEQVRTQPEGIALKFEDRELSYAAVNRQANQLARYLQSTGLKEGSPVPLYIERSPEMIIGILGILKAGSPYVPIDSDFPRERIKYMLEDSGASVVLSSSNLSFNLQGASSPGVEVIELDNLHAVLRSHSAENLQTVLSPQHLAYVIYTSGSTGQPKGVMIEHVSLVDYIYGLNQKTRIEECRSYALVSSIATDLGNTVIYSSLAFGGVLHLFSKEAISNIEYITNYFQVNAIDCLKIVPSHWSALSSGDEQLLPAKLLIFGGEALASELVERIRQSGSGCKVVNHYGPTETTIGKLLHVTAAGHSYNRSIPIGKPFCNTRVYVLSKEMQLVPFGVAGELYIAGQGLARGYQNNEALSAAKFLPNPFSQTYPLMYGTGDQVKYLADGNIEFIGRADDQVKIRGYRIELGEIERMLQESGQVSQAAVLARDDQQGNKRLIAYVVGAEGRYDRESIQSYLKEKLPEYMVPGVLVTMESLPLLASGKVDRKALPDPEAAEQSGDQYVAPRNEAERNLAEIWQEVLEVDQVGVNDDFFELGGHSLLAVRLISAIRKAFKAELPISDVFDYPTIA